MDQANWQFKLMQVMEAIFVMIDDEDGPKMLAVGRSQSDMEAMSIDELEERIILLEAEIERLRRDIKHKIASKASADNIFKK